MFVLCTHPDMLNTSKVMPGLCFVFATLQMVELSQRIYINSPRSRWSSPCKASFARINLVQISTEIVHEFLRVLCLGESETTLYLSLVLMKLITLLGLALGRTAG